MRIDFLREMTTLNSELFKRLSPGGITFLTSLDKAGIREAIEKPAYAVGLEVPPALTSSLTSDLGSDPTSLSYLQFVLRQLWLKRDKDTNSLTIKAYKDMDGLRGAIGKHAKTVYNNLSDDEKKLAQRTLPRLVNISESGRHTSRRMMFVDFSIAARSLLRKLAERDSRLIVLSSATADAEESEIIAEIAHEAIIDDWDDIASWIRDRKDFFRLRNKLEVDARTWKEKENHNADFLIPTGKPLVMAEALLKDRLPGDISEGLKTYIDASVEEKQKAETIKLKQLKLRNTWLTGLALFFIASTFFALFQANQAEDANEELARTNEELARTNENLELTADLRLAYNKAETILEGVLKACKSKFSANPVWNDLREFSRTVNHLVGEFETARNMHPVDGCQPAERVLKSADFWSANPENTLNINNEEVQRFFVAYSEIYAQKKFIEYMIENKLFINIGRLISPKDLEHKISSLCQIMGELYCAKNP